MNLESYPPEFRQKYIEEGGELIDDDERSPEDIDDGAVISIPTIDLEKCINLNPEVELLANACREWGVFRLVNHGIPETLMKQLQSQARDLLSNLSFESKQKMFTPAAAGGDVSYFWGTPALTPTGDAVAHPLHQNINWVEGFSIPLSHLSSSTPHHPYPHLLDSFRVVMEEYGKHMGRIGRRIFEAMVKSLKLEDSIEPDGHLSESSSIARVYRYLKRGTAAEAPLGMEVHTDSSVLSILYQDHVPGLQLLRDDQWFLVQPTPGSLVVNLGDMMQAISNDEYMSVKHRVKLKRNEERVSICYFVFPAQGCVIRSSNYNPFTYSDFQSQVQHDITTLGFKVGLPRFKNTPPPP